MKLMRILLRTAGTRIRIAKITLRSADAERAILIQAVVGCFFGDDNIMDMAFPDSGSCDFYKFCLSFEFLNGFAARITHSSLKSFNHHLNDMSSAAFIRHSALYSFWGDLASLEDRS